MKTSDRPPLKDVYRSMRIFGYPNSFAMSALILAREYEGILDLMYLWYEALIGREDVESYRKDIQELMNDYLVGHLTMLSKMG